MDKKTNTRLAQIVKEYAVVNEEKKEITAQAKDLGDEIKELMEEAEITEYAAAGYTANIGFRETNTLDVAAVEKLLGRPIPAECFKKKITAVLTVKAVKTEKKVA